MGAAVKPIKSGSKGFNSASRRRTYKSPIDKAKAYEVIWQQVAPLFDATRDVSDPVFVYFIGEDDGAVKIGSSKDPIGRLRTMQTGNSRRLRLEHVLLGPSHFEKLLHEIWRDFAIFSSRNARASSQHDPRDLLAGTEWFKPEIRSQLDPIIRTAVAKQIEYLNAPYDELEIDLGGLHRLLREAHYEHDFVIRGRDIPLLFTGANRISRI